MHVDHVGLVVADLDAQSAWYQRALGLEKTSYFELPAIGLRGAFVIGFNNQVAIELLERRGAAGSPRAHDPNGALLTLGWAHICLRVDDLPAAFARLVAVGAVVQFAPRDSPEPGVRMAYLNDPEGNLIELLDRKGPVGS